MQKLGEVLASVRVGCCNELVEQHTANQAMPSAKARQSASVTQSPWALDLLAWMT
jgi:hypothetical protein